MPTDFVPDPIFDHAPGPHGDFEVGGFESLANFGWQTNVAQPAPASASNRRVVFNNAMAAWGEHGPLWGVRGYNVVGKIENTELWRVGDWTNGREGSAFYLNAGGPLTLNNLRAIQCGAQALQVVWRPKETLMPAPPSPSDVLHISRFQALDCGAITKGVSVRASWPISIFSPGTKVHMGQTRVSTKLPPFFGDHGETCESHGVLLVQEGEVGARTPELVVTDLRARISKPDRSAVRLSGIDETALQLDIEVLGGPLLVDIIDTCKVVRIEFARPAQVRVFTAADPWHSPIHTQNVPSGGKFLWKT